MRILPISTAIVMAICGTLAAASSLAAEPGLDGLKDLLATPGPRQNLQPVYLPLGRYYANVHRHASTPGESFARGRAELIRAGAEASLLHSQAAVLAEEAERRAIENRALWTTAYFEMKLMNRQYRAQLRGPRPTRKDLVRYARAAKPRRMSPSELDSLTGKVSWPVLLRTERFTDCRVELEEWFSRRAAGGQLEAEQLAEVDQATRTMLEKLKGRIRRVHPMDYTAARRFLKSLAYEVRRPTG